jgi:hypothetical protein
MLATTLYPIVQLLKAHIVESIMRYQPHGGLVFEGCAGCDPQQRYVVAWDSWTWNSVPGFATKTVCMTVMSGFALVLNLNKWYYCICFSEC